MSTSGNALRIRRDGRVHCRDQALSMDLPFRPGRRTHFVVLLLAVAVILEALPLFTASTYNLAGQLTGSTDPGGITKSNSYDANGNLVQVSYPDQTTTYGYNALNEQTSMTGSAGTGPTGTGSTGTTTTSYDAAGNGTGVAGPQGTLSYTYNGSNQRLSMIQPQGTVRYGYNSAGQLIQAGSTTYTHDAAGNRTSVVGAGGTGSATYGYNDAGQMTSVTTGGATTTYGYSGNGERVSSSEGGVTTPYLYDSQQGGATPQLVSSGTTGYVSAGNNLVAEVSGGGSLALGCARWNAARHTGQVSCRIVGVGGGSGGGRTGGWNARSQLVERAVAVQGAASSSFSGTASSACSTRFCNQRGGVVRIRERQQCLPLAALAIPVAMVVSLAPLALTALPLHTFAVPLACRCIHYRGELVCRVKCLGACHPVGIGSGDQVPVGVIPKAGHIPQPVRDRGHLPIWCVGACDLLAVGIRHPCYPPSRVVGVGKGGPSPIGSSHQPACKIVLVATGPGPIIVSQGPYPRRARPRCAIIRTTESSSSKRTRSASIISALSISTSSDNE